MPPREEFKKRAPSERTNITWRLRCATAEPPVVVEHPHIFVCGFTISISRAALIFPGSSGFVKDHPSQQRYIYPCSSLSAPAVNAIIGTGLPLSCSNIRISLVAFNPSSSGIWTPNPSHALCSSASSEDACSRIFSGFSEVGFSFSLIMRMVFSPSMSGIW